MQRHLITPRPDWPKLVESKGLTYHLHETGQPYWNESACYEFSAGEIDVAERAIKDLHSLLVDVAGTVVTKGDWERLAIPEHAIPMIERSWEADDFSLYGRFDLAWMPGRAPKMLEYNADTPTSLIEAAVAQWFWLKEVKPGMDQFNSLHERLVDAWKRFSFLNPNLRAIDFIGVQDNKEDEQTVSYLMDTAMSAGFNKPRWTPIEEVGWDGHTGVFVCADRGIVPVEPMVAAFKLYPWEWLFNEDFGEHLVDAPTKWIEPPWKALLSNKAIMALAWEQHEGHPNLLPTFFDEARAGRDYVKKPKLSREGANVTVYKDGASVIETGGDYGEDGYVFQQLAEIPDFDGNRPVFGGWVVDHEPAGLGIRESNGLVTDNLSRFVPHFFRS